MLIFKKQLRGDDQALNAGKRFYHYPGISFEELAPLRGMFIHFIMEEWDSYYRLYIIDGRLCVAFIICYEHLVDGLLKVCWRVGMPEPGIPRLKSGMRKHGQNFSEYFDDEICELVVVRYSIDIELFGCQFEIVCPSLGLQRFQTSSCNENE